MVVMFWGLWECHKQEVDDDEWVPTAPEPTPILLPLVVVAIALGAVP